MMRKILLSLLVALAPSWGFAQGYNPSVGTNNTTAPAASTQMGIKDGSGKIQAASSANPVPISGTVTANGGTNLNTSALALESGGNLATLAGGVSGGKYQTNITNSSLAVTGTFWQTTQPISASSLPLPTGASTAAKQPALGTAGSASSDVLSVQGIASMTPLKVDGSGVTQPVSGTVTANAGTNLNTSALALESGGNLATLASYVLAQGANTSGQVGILSQGAVTTSAPTYTTAKTNPLSLTTGGALRGDISSYGGTATTLGQKTMSASIPITLASDQTPIPTTLSGTISTGPILSRTTQNITATGTANGVLVNVANFTSVQIRVSGTYGAPTIQFVSSLASSGTPSDALMVTKQSSGALITSDTPGANATAVYSANVSGQQQILIYASVIPSGTIAVEVNETTDPISINQYVQAVQSGTWSVTQGTTPWVVTGNKTNNNAAPGAVQTPVLAALANASAPSWTEGNQVVLSSLLNGDLRTDVTTFGGTAVVTGGVNGSEGVGGLAANGATVAGSPVYMGGDALSSESVVTTGQAGGMMLDLARHVVTSPYANRENYATGTATTTGTSDTSLVAAQGSGKKFYFMGFSCDNTGSTTSGITFKNGSGGSTVWHTIVPAGGGSNFASPIPLASTSANTALYFSAASSSTTISCSATGYAGY